MKQNSKYLLVPLGLTLAMSKPFAAQLHDVVINEIAWMGTTNSSYDEWLELKNTTAAAINLSGWSLASSDGTPSISLSGTIPANGYFLLERTDDTSVPGIPANLIYTGAMNNGGEYLELRDANTALIDEVDAWHAGDSANRATMERIDTQVSGTNSSNWANSTTSYSSGFGTPSTANSSAASSSSSSSSSGGSSSCNYPSQLEVVSINIGQGDATLIASPSKLLLADAGESYWNSHNDADKVAEVIHSRYGANCSHLDYVVISHIHLDHIGYIQTQDDANGDLLDENGNSFQEGENLLNPSFLAGFAYLVKQLNFTVGNTIIRDYKANNPNPSPQNGGSKTYRNWRAYLESPNGQMDFNPVTAQLGTSQIDLGSVNGNPIIADIIQVDGLTPSNPSKGCDPKTYFGGKQYVLRGQRYNDPNNIRPSENDLSVAFIVSLGDFNVFVGGDTSGENYNSQWGYRYHDTETCLANDAIVLNNYGGHLDVLRANHHGSSHSSNQTFFNTFNPTVTIFSVGDNNSFGHVNPAVLDRALAASEGVNSGEVLMTESGANAQNSADVCHSTQPSLCAEVADGEFPSTTESNEAGDDGVVITVASDGGSFTVQGNTSLVARNYSSR